MDRTDRIGEPDPERSGLEGRPGSRAGREAARSVPPSRSPPVASARSRGPRSSFCARRTPLVSPGPRLGADEAIFLPVAARDHRLRGLARTTGPPRHDRTWVAAGECRTARRCACRPPRRAAASSGRPGPKPDGPWDCRLRSRRPGGGTDFGSRGAREPAARSSGPVTGWAPMQVRRTQGPEAAQGARAAAGGGIRAAGLGRLRPLGPDCGGRTEASLATRGGARSSMAAPDRTYRPDPEPTPSRLAEDRHSSRAASSAAARARRTSCVR